MNTAELTINSEHTVVVTGTLDVSTCTRLNTEGLDVINHHPMSNIHFDLSQATAVDSTSLALLIHWTRRARTLKKNIMFVGFSDALYHLVCFYQLEQILPIDHHVRHHR